MASESHGTSSPTAPLLPAPAAVPCEDRLHRRSHSCIPGTSMVVSKDTQNKGKHSSAARVSTVQ